MNLENNSNVNPRFVIHSLLGEGGFGSVYLVYDNELKEACALKVIRKDIVFDKKLHSKFIKEAEIWLSFEKHPNIVSAKAIDIFNGQLSIALDFIPPNEKGINSLDKYFGRYKISKLQSLTWSIELAQSMVYANSKGLIAHRDIKPNNIMVDQSNHIKLTDFGIAIFNEIISTEKVSNKEQKYFTTSISGTPPFMAPEQFVNRSIANTKSDIYSYGIVLYQIVHNGALPFTIPKTQKLDISLWNQIHKNYQLQKIDSPLSKIINKCLQKNPELRYNNFSEILNELIFIYEEVSGEKYIPQRKEELDASEENNFAVSYFLFGNFNKALYHVEKSLTLLPNFPQALNNKASILAELKDFKEAIKIWQSLTSTAPYLSRPFYNLANFYMAMKDYPQAISYYKSSLEIDSEYVPAIVNLALCYQNTENYKTAFELYDRAMDLEPNDANIFYNKAVLLLGFSDFQFAIRCFERVIQLNPQHVSSYNYLGVCYKELKQPEKALEYFKKALKINPNYSYAIKNKSELEKELKSNKGFIKNMFGI